MTLAGSKTAYAEFSHLREIYFLRRFTARFLNNRLRIKLSPFVLIYDFQNYVNNFGKYGNYY